MAISIKLRDKRRALGLCTECGKPSSMFKQCVSCREEKRIRAIDTRRKFNGQGFCTVCGKNPPPQFGKICLSCREVRRYEYDVVKRECFAAYGGSFCKCCGDAHFEFLSIDHIDGGGRQHRKEIGAVVIYQWLKKNNFPPGFQVLCMNCNCGKERNGGMCPHDADRKNHRKCAHDQVSLASGLKCGRNMGHVDVASMGWQLGRLCRWTGAGDQFWSVLLHSFVVADLVREDWLKCHALIHDSPECVGNDVPSPMKSDDTRAYEDAIMARTLPALFLPRLSEEERRIIKVADVRAMHGEAWVIGNDGNRNSYPDRDFEVEALVRCYLSQFPYRETIERSGRGPAEFVKRFWKYWLLARQHHERAT